MLSLDRDTPTILSQLDRVKQRFPENVDFANFENKVREGEIQIFPIRNDSVMVGQMYDDGSVVILAAAGVMDDILDFLPLFCDWYYEKGCRKVTLSGRRGWRRALSHMGWKPGDHENELVKVLERKI